MEVGDDGVGFQMPQTGPTSRERCGFGLFSIRERLRPYGGVLKVQSEPRGRHPRHPDRTPGSRFRRQNSTMSTKILLADDHQIMREGLVALLEREPGLQVVGRGRRRPHRGAPGPGAQP